MSSAYPIPPFSPPKPPSKDSPLCSTIDALHSLLDFYHERRIWAARTRTDLTVVSSDNPSKQPTEGTASPELHGHLATRWAHGPASKDGCSSGLDKRKEYMLELFDKLMETRLESCHRVQRLLQQAGVDDAAIDKQSIIRSASRQLLATVPAPLP